MSKPYKSTRSLAIAFYRYNNEWMEKALCRRVNPEMFYPAPRDPDEGRRIFEAIQVCTGCPVRYECLDFALKNKERHGIWGGMTPNQRTRLRNEHVKRVA